jgi:hypothetical protein
MAAHRPQSGGKRATARELAARMLAGDGGGGAGLPPPHAPQTVQHDASAGVRRGPAAHASSCRLDPNVNFKTGRPLSQGIRAHMDEISFGAGASAGAGAGGGAGPSRGSGGGHGVQKATRTAQAGTFARTTGRESCMGAGPETRPMPTRFEALIAGGGAAPTVARGGGGGAAMGMAGGAGGIDTSNRTSRARTRSFVGGSW